jgi:Leucine-rich repeat (LRR) protein
LRITRKVATLKGSVTWHWGSVRVVTLNGPHVSDDDLAFLSEFSNLRVLNLRNTSVTDAGLVYLKPLTNLKSLDLSDSNQISDDAAQELVEELPYLPYYTRETLTPPNTAQPQSSASMPNRLDLAATLLHLVN